MMVNAQELMKRMADIQENADHLRAGLQYRHESVTGVMPAIEKVINDYNASVDDPEKQIDAIAIGGIGIMLLINVFISITDSMAAMAATEEGGKDIPLSEFFEDARNTFAAVIVTTKYPQEQEREHAN
jgi:hypothetical protein